MRCFRNMLFIVLGVVASSLARADDPYISGVETVTPQIYGANPENSTMVRLNDTLYFIYRVKSADPSYDGAVFIREFLLGDQELAAQTPVLVDADARYPACPTCAQEHYPDMYHTEPSILRLGNDLTALYSWGVVEQHGSELWYVNEQREQSYESDSITPRQWVIPPDHLQDPNRPPPDDNWDAWLRSTSEGGLPSLTWNNLCPLPSYHGRSGALLYDIMGVTDLFSGVTHFVGEGVLIRETPGTDPACPAWDGVHRVYYRFAPGLSNPYDGPYYLIKGTYPLPTPSPCGGGNVFTKGDLALGKEIDGARSLHLLWNIRNTFTVPPAPDCTHLAQLNYGLYYAKSTDGGDTWTDMAGNNPVQLQDPVTGERHAITYPYAPYRVYPTTGDINNSGDVLQGAERAFDVDSYGHPVIVSARPVANTGCCINVADPNATLVACDRQQQGASFHVDERAAGCGPGVQPLQYELVCMRWLEWPPEYGLPPQPLHRHEL